MPHIDRARHVRMFFGTREEHIFLIAGTRGKDGGRGRIEATHRTQNIDRTPQRTVSSPVMALLRNISSEDGRFRPRPIGPPSK